MVKYTPGGARNFLVPSRLNPGTFYALAESPQIFKQLFMVAGFDRYFQIVRCFRDEDLRQDRQPEFTQIDLEMSFVVEEDVQTRGRAPDGRAVEGHPRRRAPHALPRMSYAEAIGLYGSDKPDLRFGLPLVDLTEVVRKHDGGGVEMLRAAVAAGRGDGVVKGWRLPAEHAGQAGPQRGRQAGGLRQGLRRPRPGPRPHRRRRRLDPVAGQDHERRHADRDRTPPRACRRATSCSCSSARKKLANTVLGALRLHLAEQLELIPRRRHRRLEVLPGSPSSRCSRRPTTASWSPPTTPSPRPSPRICPASRAEPASVRARAYDLVLNGNEMAGGSIRIHRPDVQARVFAAMGLSPEDARAKFGFLLDAFKYGPPAPRRHRRRRRSPGHAALRGRVAARRDRLPQDPEGHRPLHRRPRPGLASASSTSCTSRSSLKVLALPCARPPASRRSSAASPTSLRRPGGGWRAPPAPRSRATRPCAGWRWRCVDRGDFAGETSSQSSKLIHGGSATSSTATCSLVFEALAERRRLMRTAPPPVPAGRVHLARLPGAGSLAAQADRRGGAVRRPGALPPAGAAAAASTRARAVRAGAALRTAGLTGAHRVRRLPDRRQPAWCWRPRSTPRRPGAAVATYVEIEGRPAPRRGHLHVVRAHDRGGRRAASPIRATRW